MVRTASIGMYAAGMAAVKVEGAGTANAKRPAKYPAKRPYSRLANQEATPTVNSTWNTDRNDSANLTPPTYQSPAYTALNNGGCHTGLPIG